MLCILDGLTLGARFMRFMSLIFLVNFGGNNLSFESFVMGFLRAFRWVFEKLKASKVL